MYNDWMCEVIVGLVDIGGIVDHHYLNFFFIIKTMKRAIQWSLVYTFGSMSFESLKKTSMHFPIGCYIKLMSFSSRTLVFRYIKKKKVSKLPYKYMEQIYPVFFQIDDFYLIGSYHNLCPAVAAILNFWSTKNINFVLRDCNDLTWLEVIIQMNFRIWILAEIVHHQCLSFLFIFFFLKINQSETLMFVIWYFRKALLRFC